jgi:hypothetical protein
MRVVQPGQQSIALDPPVHYYMTDVDVLRLIFTRNALRKIA